MEVSVRPAELRDVEAIARIHVDSWEDTYRGVLADEVIDSRDIDLRRRVWTETLTDQDPRIVVLVGEAEGAIRGFAVGGPSFYEDEDPDEVINLNAIYLDTSYKGTGVALALNNGFLRAAVAVGYKRASGQIAPGNTRSIRFFTEKGGWHADGFERVNEGSLEHRYVQSLADLPELG